MTVENFNNALDQLLNLRPFRIFSIEMTTGKIIEIDHPLALSYRNGMASFIAPGNIPIWFDHESVSRIIASSSHTVTEI